MYGTFVILIYSVIFLAPSTSRHAGTWRKTWWCHPYHHVDGRILSSASLKKTIILLAYLFALQPCHALPLSKRPYIILALFNTHILLWLHPLCISLGCDPCHPCQVPCRLRDNQQFVVPIQIFVHIAHPHVCVLCARLTPFLSFDSSVNATLFPLSFKYY